MSQRGIMGSSIMDVGYTLHAGWTCPPCMRQLGFIHDGLVHPPWWMTLPLGVDASKHHDGVVHQGEEARPTWARGSSIMPHGLGNGARGTPGSSLISLRTQELGEGLVQPPQDELHGHRR